MPHTIEPEVARALESGKIQARNGARRKAHHHSADSSQSRLLARGKWERRDVQRHWPVVLAE